MGGGGGVRGVYLYVMVQIFSWFKIFNQFNFDFSLFGLMIMNIEQQTIKIELVWKNFEPRKKVHLNHNIDF